MKERPILFKAEMVNAVLAGRKTQTRRIAPVDRVDPVSISILEPLQVVTLLNGKSAWLNSLTNHPGSVSHLCKYGKIGDRLWVKETFFPTKDWRHAAIFANAPDIVYRADYSKVGADYAIGCHHWKPSIYMPRWASRITLEITDVRMQRLQEISRGDAMAEGCPFANMADGPDPREWYAALWKSINGKGSWDQNPWVWVIEFRKLEGGAK